MSTSPGKHPVPRSRRAGGPSGGIATFGSRPGRGKRLDISMVMPLGSDFQSSSVGGGSGGRSGAEHLLQPIAHVLGDSPARCRRSFETIAFIDLLMAGVVEECELSGKPAGNESPEALASRPAGWPISAVSRRVAGDVGGSSRETGGAAASMRRSPRGRWAGRAANLCDRSGGALRARAKRGCVLVGECRGGRGSSAARHSSRNADSGTGRERQGERGDG